MTGLRVAMVTRRFWPLAGSGESMVADVGEELKQQGLAPLVLTARIDPRWPKEVVFRELAVHRLPFPRRFGWVTLRFLIALSRWLRRNRPDIDLVYVWRLSREAHAIIGALEGSGIPVVVHAESDDPLGSPSLPQRRLVSRIVRRCHSAAAVVTSSETTRNRLLDAGFNPQRVHVVPYGVACPAPRTQAGKQAARAALAGVNEDLRVGLNMPVVACIGPLEPPYELDALVSAWQRVAQDHPHARLWLVGDGTHRERLYRRIQQADLVGRVLMPGTFDDLDDVLQASDLLIVPSAAVDQTYTILKAMAAHVPVLAAARKEHDNLVRDGVRGRTLGDTTPQALAAAILAALAGTRHGESMAETACEFVRQHCSLREMARQHHQLFTHLIHASKRPVP